MPRAPEKLRLRTFKVPEDIELRLSHHAEGRGESKADVARRYLDEMLASGTLPTVRETGAPLVLRTYYLSPEQDAKLESLIRSAARQGEHLSKGELFRAALIRGLGVAPARTHAGAVSSAVGGARGAALAANDASAHANVAAQETRKRRPSPAARSRKPLAGDLAAALRVVSGALASGALPALAVAIFDELAKAASGSANAAALGLSVHAQPAELRGALKLLEKAGAVARNLDEISLVAAS